MKAKMRTYMVVEHFKEGCWETAYVRFHEKGRLLPNGLSYVNSWANKEKSVCYQLMQTTRPELFDVWFERWSDLVDFELIMVDP